MSGTGGQLKMTAAGLGVSSFLVTERGDDRACERDDKSDYVCNPRFATVSMSHDATAASTLNHTILWSDICLSHVGKEVVIMALT